MSNRRILVTSALPYANGHIHLGHLVEYIQTDIWVRFQKLRGHRCIYLCADDTHGTAIMIRARQEGRSEEAMIADMHDAHVRDFADFDIEFDNYGSTHSDENRELCAEFWAAIRKSGHVKEKDVEQLFDTEAETFLADRFVRGTCPKCDATDQPGDNCSKCGAHYSPIDLVDAKSTLSGSTPEVRTSSHLFIELEKLHGFLEEWSQSGEHLQPEIANYLKGHFLHEPLRDWDVSRPGPYFGFEIPDSPGNYWYVWFDAPIGYVASTQQWCKRTGESLDDWWKNGKANDDSSDPDDPSSRVRIVRVADGRAGAPEIHHFIGKDITYFHTLFWPGMLKMAGFNLPTKVHIHGFLTVEGEKMSKSKGTLVNAAEYLKHLDPSHLRYFYASRLSQRIDDFDLSIGDFVKKVNSDLVGKVVNLASRSAKFVQGKRLSETYPDDGGLFQLAADASERIAGHYEDCDYGAAMREIMSLADSANRFVDQKEPWKLRKDAGREDELRDICTVALNLFRQIVIYLTPVLPKLAGQTAELLDRPIKHWDEVAEPLLAVPVAKFKHMLARINEEQVQKMIVEDKLDDPTSPQADDLSSQPNQVDDLSSQRPHADRSPVTLTRFADGPEALEAEPIEGVCTFDDFVKVDLRVARVVTAEEIPDARKLLKLTLSLGGDVEKTVFAGIKAAYAPVDLVGRLVIFAANLAPRKMRFGISEGMVLAAGPGGKDVFLLKVDEGAVPGQRVH